MNTRRGTTDQISELNIQIYNFQFVQTQTAALKQAVESLDKAFAGLDAEKVCTIINTGRKKAKMSEASANDVRREINRKRADLRQIITEKTAGIPEKQYVKLVTMLAEKSAKDEKHGGIIEDMVDQYEIRMHDSIQKNANDISNTITKIRNADYKHAKNYDSDINSLLQKVRNWDKLAQPVQLKAQASGMTHEISQQLGKELRDLAIYLHNEKNATEVSVRITEAMKSIFAELPELSAALENDAELLKEQKKQKSIAESLEKLQRTADELTNKRGQTDEELSSRITGLFKSAQSLDKTIRNTQSISEENKKQLRKTACMIIRGAAIKLHNEQQKTRIAADMTERLMDMYGDLPEQKAQLQGEYQQLEQMSAQSNLPERIKELKRQADNFVDDGYCDFYSDRTHYYDSNERGGSVIEYSNVWINSLISWKRNEAATSIAEDLLRVAKYLDKDIRTAGGLDAGTKNQLRTAVCMIVRGTAIRLHNEKTETELAAYMLGELLQVYGDLPELKKQLTGEYKQLSDMAGEADRVRAQKIFMSIAENNKEAAGVFAQRYQGETGRSLFSDGQTTSAVRKGSATQNSSSSGSTGLVLFILFVIFAIISSSSGWI